MPYTVKAYGCTSKTSQVEPMQIDRRDMLPEDVKIKIEWCGVCYSDLHVCHGDWLARDDPGHYPIVPGHEIVGKVTQVGDKVTAYKVGDKVAVGTRVDCCGKCKYCNIGEEAPCPGFIGTYGSRDPHLGGYTQGGYSEDIVVKDHFVFSVPDSIYGPAAAPLLCAGITAWTPISEANIKPGQKVGVVGLGGLGHMGVKFLKALGAEVWGITTSKKKLASALKLGAKGIVVSTDEVDMAKHSDTFDFIYNTVPVEHDINPYIKLLQYGGVQVIVGVVGKLEFDTRLLLFGKKSIKMSNIGNTKQIQKMLDFCGENGITSVVEMVSYEKVNQAWERLAKNDVEYRFVLDNSTL